MITEPPGGLGTGRPTGGICCPVAKFTIRRPFCNVSFFLDPNLCAMAPRSGKEEKAWRR